jgi:uncharacterized linocin/CFP29 family protein
MDFLRRTLAPIADRAWEEIDAAVKQVLTTRLCGRTVVDVDGPRGLDTAAVGLGRLELGENPKAGRVGWGVHRLQPLIEARIAFELDLWELDNLARGAADVDFGPAEEAALAMARFEDEAIFNGFKRGSIGGLVALRAHDPVPIPLDPDGFLQAAVKAVLSLEDGGVEGPHALLLGPEPYRLYVTHTGGYPLKKQVQTLVGGPVLYAPSLQGALLLSQRGGDFVLTVGQDLAVGYETRAAGKATFFLTESFTFRIIEPAAGVALPLAQSRKRK